MKMITIYTPVNVQRTPRHFQPYRKIVYIIYELVYVGKSVGYKSEASDFLSDISGNEAFDLIVLDSMYVLCLV